MERSSATLFVTLSATDGPPWRFDTRAAFVAPITFGGLMLVLAATCLAEGREPSLLWACLATGVAFITLAFVGWHRQTGGRGSIDEEGITFRPMGHAGWQMRWQDIEKVCWRRGSVTLVGDGRTVNLRWARDAARQVSRPWLQAKLQPAFDLADPPPGPRFSFLRVATATAVCSLPILILWWMVGRNRAPAPEWRLLMLLAPMVLLTLGGFWAARQERIRAEVWLHRRRTAG